MIRADFEYLCHPYPTLPHWFGFAVGPLLMADHFEAGAIALGGTFETFYMDMGRRWTGERPEARGIDDLPALAGMPIIRPVLGLTEVGTMRLTLESDLAGLARSCAGGTYTDPCGVCSKCIRKDLIAAAVSEAAVPDSLRYIDGDAAGMKSLSGRPPYYMQAQLEFALSRLEVGGSVGELYKRMGCPEAAGTEWMMRAYEPAVMRLPDPWRASVAQRIESALGWMNADDVTAAMNYVR